MMRCLFCYQPLAKNEIDFHPACSKKIFGQSIPPVLPYSELQMEDLANYLTCAPFNYSWLCHAQEKCSCQCYSIY